VPPLVRHHSPFYPSEGETLIKVGSPSTILCVLRSTATSARLLTISGSLDFYISARPGHHEMCSGGDADGAALDASWAELGGADSFLPAV
jgi:hypothetical protein